MYNREPIALTRSVEAILIPSGSEVIIPEGTEVNVAQAMGGSFTVYVSGNLARISGQDADALGLEPLRPPELPENASDGDIEKLVWEQMKTCYDPEIPINIVDLGLIYECRLNDTEDGMKTADVTMTLTAPGCGMGDILVADVREKILMVPRIKSANVEMVFDPPWSREMMSDEAKVQLGLY